MKTVKHMTVNTAFNSDVIFTRKIVGGKASIWRQTITPFHSSAV